MKTNTLIMCGLLLGLIILSGCQESKSASSNTNNDPGNKENVPRKIEDAKAKEYLILKDLGNYDYDRQYSFNAKKERQVSANEKVEEFSHEEYWAYYNCETEGCAEVIVRNYPSSFEARNFVIEKTEVGWTKEMIEEIEVYKFDSDASRQFIWKIGSRVINVNGVNLEQFNKDIDGRGEIETLFDAYFEKYS